MRLVSARVVDAEPGVDLSAADVDDSRWHSVPVPGDLHVALAEAGLQPHPHDEPGDDAFTWMEAREWWFRLPFPAQQPVGPGERLRLVFDGVDTFATYWLNGHELGRSTNMFRTVAFDIGELVRTDAPNVVTVRIERPLGLDLPSRDDVPRMRKAQFSYGWDFAPRRPGIGLWQPVSVVQDRRAVLRHVRPTTTSLTSDLATVRIDVGIDRLDDRPLDVTAVLLAPGGGQVSVAEQVLGTSVVLDLRVPDPQPWWTHDRGAPVLHDLLVTVRSGEDVLAESACRIGLRTVELDESPDPDEPPSRFFRLRLNGELLEVRGANWVPCDTALGAVDPDRRSRLVELAKDAGMNCLRVWGGGTYEADAFYDRCDELGILVWQDLMFACAAYPDDDPAWLADVEAEIRHQADRLTAHPCVGLWCGNNEVELLAGIFDWGSASPAQKLFYDIAPQALGTTGVPYVPTSPFRGNGSTAGDRHNWQVWHGVDEGDPATRTGPGWQLGQEDVDPLSQRAAQFAADAGPHRYLEDSARFVSEYGLGSAPSLETLVRRGVDDLETARARLRPPRLGPRNKLEILLAASVGLPDDLAGYVALSQLLQAEGVKVGAEHYRRRWPHCSGSLIWQLDDCWPSLSWAMIDADLRPKAVYHYAKRFFTPVLASFAPTDAGCEVWVSNSTTTAVEDVLVLRTATFGGRLIEEAELEVRVPALTSRPVLTLPVPADPRGTYISLQSAGGLANRHFFAPIKDLERPPGEPEVAVQDVGDDLVVTVTGAGYHLLVHAVPEDPGVVFDDNFVDLAPGAERVLTARGGAGSQVVVRSL